MTVRQNRAQSYESQSSHISAYSESSEYSRSTAPTVYSDRPCEVGKLRYSPVDGEISNELSEPEQYYGNDPRGSVDTYASTIPSQDDLPAVPSYEVPIDRGQIFPPTSIPSTPQEFAHLFPSQRRLLIRHDDSTVDGNMNLCIDTEIFEPRTKPQRISLFHLRLKDLHERETSLRRYCRDSGREVCHSGRMVHRPQSQRRPGIQRSLTNAMHTIGLNGLTLKGQPEMKRSNTFGGSGVNEEEEFSTTRQSQTSRTSAKVIQLEFSNYAHVNLISSGKKSSKRYDFEYWGIKYQWKREIRNEGDTTEISYHLSNASTSRVLAHIMPDMLTKEETREEEYKGGWIPPSSLWISDKRTVKGSPDLAESVLPNDAQCAIPLIVLNSVIVSTGLMVLVDDCIQCRWHSRRRVQLNVPVQASPKESGSYIGPRRLVDEVFHRGSNTRNRHE
ncbi:MAG: hypothetical protein Q9160_006681 [Pyrenula sp. 1 TL-2023]